ncbi:MAG: universal stress protein [Hyphomicrobiales bacterium]
MFERILVAIDGGKNSKEILKTACVLADASEANLGIIYVTDPRNMSDDLVQGAEVEGVIEGETYSQTIDRFDYGGRDKLREELQHSAMVARIAEQVGQIVVAKAESFSKQQHVNAVKTFVRSGDVVKAILSVARQSNADLIVMGHERRSIIGALIHRSVAEGVNDEAKCPCLIFSS